MRVIRSGIGRMRIVAHNDGLLLAGLAVAGLTMFDRTLGIVLEVATDVEKMYGVRLVPALVVLTGILIVHLHAKRQEMKAAAAAASLQARLAEERSRELENLSQLGAVLASAVTVEALRAAAVRSVPPFVSRPFCLVTRTPTGWNPLVDTTEEGVGERAVAPESTLEGVELRRPFVRQQGYCVFPLLAGPTMVGALMVREGEVALADPDERVLIAVTSLLAIAVRNVQSFAALQETALTDALTGCYNRTHLVQVLDAELRRARRTGAHLAVIMIDIDGFKRVNDTLGHLAGDATLAAIGQALRSALRRSDVRCRVGGDEFAVILPDTYPAGAEHVAGILRRDISKVESSASQPAGVTASIGVACAEPGEAVESLLSRADRAQYRAKREGGDRVIVDGVRDDQVALVRARGQVAP